MSGASPLGTVNFDKIFDGGGEGAAGTPPAFRRRAGKWRSVSLLNERWKSRERRQPRSRRRPASQIDRGGGAVSAHSPVERHQGAAALGSGCGRRRCLHHRRRRGQDQACFASDFGELKQIAGGRRHEACRYRGGLGAAAVVGCSQGTMSLMNLPNIITIARILRVPLTIWLIVSGDYLAWRFWYSCSPASATASMALSPSAMR